MWERSGTRDKIVRAHPPDGLCPCCAGKGPGHRRAGRGLSSFTVWTCLVSFSIIRCLIAPPGPVDACAAVIMIYSQPVAWGSLLLASSVTLDLGLQDFSARFVNDDTQEAASVPLPSRSRSRMVRPLPEAVSEKGRAPLKQGGLGAWGMRWEGRQNRPQVSGPGRLPRGVSESWFLSPAWDPGHISSPL